MVTSLKSNIMLTAEAYDAVMQLPPGEQAKAVSAALNRGDTLCYPHKAEPCPQRGNGLYRRKTEYNSEKVLQWLRKNS